MQRSKSLERLCQRNCPKTNVGAYVKDEVEVEKREEAAVTEFLRAVDVSLPNLMAGGFYYGADGVSYGVRHDVVVSKKALSSGCVWGVRQASRMESMVRSQSG